MSAFSNNPMPLAGYLRDMRTLKPNDIRNVSVTLIDTSDPSAAGVGSTEKYQVPSTHRFMLTGIRGVVEGLDVDLEAAEAGLAIATVYSTRVLARAARAAVKVWNSDRSENITEEKPVSLAAICPAAGGMPINFNDAPLIFQPGETIAMEVTKYGTAADAYLIGTAGTFDYGVTLEGVLIPKNMQDDGSSASFLRTFAREMTKLTADDYRRVLVTMEVAPPAALTEKAEVTYRVPGTHNLAIHGIFGHLTFNAYQTEVNAAGDLIATSNGIAERMLARAARAYLKLKTTDNGSDVEIIRGDAKQTSTGGGGISVASINPVTGVPLDLAFHPQIVPANETLTLNVDWSGGAPFANNPAVLANADYANANKYGITLVGALVRKSY